MLFTALTSHEQWKSFPPFEHIWWYICPRQIWKCYVKVKWFADKGKRGGKDKNGMQGQKRQRGGNQESGKRNTWKIVGSIPSLEESLMTEFFILLKTNPMFGNATHQKPSSLALLSHFSVIYSYIWILF